MGFNSVSGVLESGMATVGAGYVFVRKRRHLFKGVLGFGLCREVGGIGYRWEEENKKGESSVPAVGMGNDFWVYASGADDDENEWKNNNFRVFWLILSFSNLICFIGTVWS